MFYLLLRQRFHWAIRIDDHRDSIVGDDSRLHVNAFGRCGADLGGFGAAARHPDLRGPVDDRRDSSSRTFRRDVEGSTGVLRLKLFGQLWHQFCPKRVGTFNNQAIRVSRAGESENGN